MFLVETLLHRRSTYIEQAGCCDTMDTRLNEENTLESRVEYLLGREHDAPIGYPFHDHILI